MKRIQMIQARLQDAPAILALQKLVYQSEAERYQDWNIPPLTQKLLQLESEFDFRTFLKAMHGTRIVGSVRASLGHGTCLIGRLIVHPDFQKQGIGTALLERIEAHFPDTERILTIYRSRSTENIRLYQKIGFRIFREEDLSPSVKFVFMEKKPGV